MARRVGTGFSKSEFRFSESGPFEKNSPVAHRPARIKIVVSI